MASSDSSDAEDSDESVDDDMTEEKPGKSNKRKNVDKEKSSFTPKKTKMETEDVED